MRSSSHPVCFQGVFTHMQWASKQNLRKSDKCPEGIFYLREEIATFLLWVFPVSFVGFNVAVSGSCSGAENNGPHCNGEVAIIAVSVNHRMTEETYLR